MRAIAEREKLGASHPEIGAYLLGLWDLPHDIIEAARGLLQVGGWECG